MDIRNWPFDQIMQLPDHCFGRKFPIILGIRSTDVLNHYLISEIGLPEACVLWEIWFNSIGGDGAFLGNVPGTISLALGDRLPATDAEFNALETLFPEVDEILTGARTIRAPLSLKLRKPYRVSGRRVVARWLALQEDRIDMVLGLVFSSIPKEVPDWLISG